VKICKICVICVPFFNQCSIVIPTQKQPHPFLHQ